MVINTISPENKGFAVSAFLFFATIAGTIATTVLGALSTKYDVGKEEKGVYPNAPIIGHILVIFVGVGYALSIPFFILAGRSYKEFKETEAREKQLSATEALR